MKTYRKLVRDKIPEIARAEGQEVHTQALSEESFRIALADKLQEAVAEYSADPTSDGLVDILELTYAIAEAKYGLSTPQLETLRQQRLEERGGYETRTLLVDTSN